MKLTAAGAVLRLSRLHYKKESLEAAALSLSAVADVYLESRPKEYSVTLELKGRKNPAAARLAAGEFLNEALNHAYRQDVIRAHQEFTGPALSLVFDRGFPSPRPDPLEELEPQVALDRAEDARRIFEQAKKREGGAA